MYGGMYTAGLCSGRLWPGKPKKQIYRVNPHTPRKVIRLDGDTAGRLTPAQVFPGIKKVGGCAPSHRIGYVVIFLFPCVPGLRLACTG